VPLSDPGFDLRRAHPEDSAFGPAGALVVLGYLSGGVAWLAVAAVLAWAGGWAVRLGAILLTAGGATSLALAIDPRPVTGGLLAAGLLGLAIGPLAVSVALGDRLGRPRAPLVGLGIAVGLGFGALALSPHELAGLVNRSWDVLLATWQVALGFAVARLR
jgi:hypothetical protein